MGCANSKACLAPSADQKSVEIYQSLLDTGDGGSLVPVVKALLELLWAVDTVSTSAPEGLYSLGMLHEAVRRYESFWLPLVAATRSDDLQKLTPPLDVAWVWFVHRLDPMAYRVDCMKLVKKELDTTHFPGVEKLPLALPRLAQSDDNFLKGVDFTAAIWEQKFAGESYFPQYLGAPEAETVAATSNFDSALTYDLPRACVRQKDFVRNVFSQAIFSNLKPALKRFSQFLALTYEAQQQGRGRLMVPLLDVELFWRAHMTCTALYRRVCTSVGFMGGSLGHDVRLDDRNPEGPLNKHMRQTSMKWKQLYENDYKVSPAVQFKGAASGARALHLDNNPKVLPPWPIRLFPTKWSQSFVVPPESYKFDTAAPRGSFSGKPACEIAEGYVSLATADPIFTAGCSMEEEEKVGSGEEWNVGVYEPKKKERKSSSKGGRPTSGSGAPSPKPGGGAR